MNVIRTTFLMAAMTALFVGAGGLIAGEAGLIMALAIAAVMNVFAYWNSDKMVLRMHGAREVDAVSAPDLYRMVNRLAQRANLPMPRVYIMDNDQPNAFATGRNPQNAAVAATTGLLRRLSRDEVEGVMAHELAHVANRDTLIMTITATLAGAISMLANFALFFGNNRNNPLGIIGTILVMVLAPLAATLVQMAISRTREYAADKLGAEICGNPRALASALDRISGGSAIENPAAEANPASAHLFIANPLRRGGVDALFATHPPMAERIRRLEAMAGSVRADRGRTTGTRDTKARDTKARDTKGLDTGGQDSTERPMAGRSGIPDSGSQAGRKDPTGPWG